MSTTLIQKHLVKGTREFEIVEDVINYRIKGPLQDEELSVVLSVLNAEPVINESTVEFTSQVNQEPLLEFLRDKPDKPSFDAFIATLQQRICEEDFGRLRVDAEKLDIDVEQLRTAISMLQTYLDPDDLRPLLDSLAALCDAPDEMDRLRDVVNAFNALGPLQGSVLTYVPYINGLLTSQFESEPD